MNFPFYLPLINFTLSSHVWLVAAAVDRAGKTLSVAPPNDPPFLKVALLKITSKFWGDFCVVGVCCY